MKLKLAKLPTFNSHRNSFKYIPWPQIRLTVSGKIEQNTRQKIARQRTELKYRILGALRGGSRA